MTELWLDIKMKDLQEAVRKSPMAIAQAILGAGKETGAEIIETPGLGKYPSATDANRPPTPYYIRGRGMEYASGSDYKSEQYGKQWNVKTYADKVVIGNRSSYAKFVGGDKQPMHMHLKGWRQLANVARMKIPVIRRIYEKWIARALKRAGFK